MDVETFLNELRAADNYAGQIVYTRTVSAREASFAQPQQPVHADVARMLAARGIGQLYTHQAAALDEVRAGRNIVVVSTTASGKSLCYQVPALEMLLESSGSTALMLFPTKALSQDQSRSFQNAAEGAGVTDALTGIYDGDTPASLRRRLRDHASVVMTNPDMLHAALMPHHGRWQRFLATLKLVVIDELHVYNGLFGSNMANLLRRFVRVCAHYGSDPQFVTCSATIANPLEQAEGLTGRPFSLIDNDGSPRGQRTYVFWNPPRVRNRDYRSRRSANVEAHELMAELVRRGIGTITFSKAKMTAEMIHRYVCENLSADAPHLAAKVSPYRGGYPPQQRRQIEQRLFSGELLGVSATGALELGIDIGSLDAAIVVGYPGTRVSFFQQTGRAGRGADDALIFLIGLDTSVNQYIMGHPDYLFERTIEQAVLDVDNPFITTGHLRCATHELPLHDDETPRFGTHAGLVLDVLRDAQKVARIDDRWYHASEEIPQHEVSLRDCVDANVIIQDIDTGESLGEVNRLDAPPILHAGAVYMHLGQTYLVRELDLQRNIASVRRLDVDYYTNPLGGTDVHHVDQPLREKPFGTGKALWGEVTAHFNTWGFEKIHFYTLDAVSVHPVDLPTTTLETMAVWLVPPEQLMADLLRRGVDHSGLPGIGYATRMLLPLFVTCDTLDFSHSIGAVNAPWNAIFIYERYPHGLGFTEKAFNRLDEIMPAVLDMIRSCPCEDGCPCCVGKPLRRYAAWYYDRGEASIPSKQSAVAILEGLLAGGDNLAAPPADAMTDSPQSQALRLEQMLRRRLEQMRQPRMFHSIEPQPQTAFPPAPTPESLAGADVAARRTARKAAGRELRKRLAKRIHTDDIDSLAPKTSPPERVSRAHNKPAEYPGKPDTPEQRADDIIGPTDDKAPIHLGSRLASRARKKLKRAEDQTPGSP